MKSHIEFEGKNIGQAIEKACDNLKITKEQLKYDVLSYGSSGIFGIVGVKNAKIRVKNTNPKLSNIVNEVFNEEKAKPKEETEPIKKIGDNTDIDYESLLELGNKTIETIVSSISSDVKIHNSMTNNGFVFHINCENPSMLIGRKGRTLEAIQYIVEKILNKKQKKKTYSQIDVEDYLENRKKKLTSSAIKLAQKVKHTGKPMSMGEMSFGDRRVVHLLLKKEKNIRTRSLGEGYYKKLIIFPQNYNGEKNGAE